MDTEKVATSFYVSNIPDSLDAKGLWKACVSYARLVDAYIANKLSKEEKDSALFIFLELRMHLISSNPYQIYRLINTKPHPSFDSLLHNKPNPVTTTPSQAITRSVILNDHDLISVEDSPIVILVKLKDVDSMSNMYMICKNESFLDLKIHHVEGLWIWIQFPSSLSCAKFQDNASMQCLHTSIKPASPSFKVDERLIWVEINGLPLCAWGSNAFKKVVVHGEIFEVHVYELGTWSINITDDSIDTSSHIDVNEIEKVANSVEENSVDDLNDNFNEMAHGINKDEVQMDNLNATTMEQPQFFAKENNHNDFNLPKVGESSDPSHPPGFEHMKKSFSHTSKCSTSFARHYKKDIKGVSLIHELNRIIEVGTTLGFNVRGSDHFNSFISLTGLIDLIIRGRLYTWMNKAGTKLSKVDRFLISDEVLEILPDIRITVLDRLWSDHTHVLLHILKSDFGLIPFKLYNSWLSRDGFDDVIKAAWSSLENNNNDGRILKCQIDKKRIDDGIATPSDRDTRMHLLQEIDKLDNFEAFDLIQKAHIKRDIEGDKNLKFFHGLLNQKRRYQSIKGIMRDGVWITYLILIKELFLNFFKEKLQVHVSQVVFPPLVHSTRLCPLDSEYLETHVSLDEIKSAIWDCGSNKAPDPNGFNFAFVKKY
ncbi:RNA-directed DNA polymerase, eukaryota, reverse transcriptase zinc-binding domain protein [Tanacetum coccineum]